MDWDSTGHLRAAVAGLFMMFFVCGEYPTGRSLWACFLHVSLCCKSRGCMKVICLRTSGGRGDGEFFLACLN